MPTPEQNKGTDRVNKLIGEVYHCVAEDIGVEEAELKNIKQGLNRDAIDKLRSNEWNDNELKDLFTAIFHASEENRVGVFGSMSKENGPATMSSDIDIVIEANKAFPESVSLTQDKGVFSGRAIDIFIFKGDGAKIILGNEYHSVLWIYENPQWLDAQDAAIYEFMYRF